MNTGLMMQSRMSLEMESISGSNTIMITITPNLFNLSSNNPESTKIKQTEKLLKYNKQIYPLIYLQI